MPPVIRAEEDGEEGQGCTETEEANQEADQAEAPLWGAPVVPFDLHSAVQGALAEDARAGKSACDVVFCLHLSASISVYVPL